MENHEALRQAVGRDAMQHAKALGLSTNLVHRWCEPHTDFTDSGAFNPLDRIETVIRTALSLRKGRDEALAPLQCLAHKFSLVMIDVPHEAATPKQIIEDLSDVIARFSMTTAETARAMEDGRISKIEAYRIQDTVWDLIEKLVRFNRKVQETMT
jgi:hypothetical protein